MYETIWDIAFGRWRCQPVLEPGYTLLLTVPPDLPVLLKLAVEVCRRQDLTHLGESLVIPDHVHPPFRSVVETLATQWPQGRLRLVELRTRDRLIRSRLAPTSAGTIHWLQLIAGIEADRTTHAVLHDADLFLMDRGFLRTHYETCVEQNLSALGLDRPFSGFDWRGQPGFEHLVACWEIMFDIRWARSRPPSHLKPRRNPKRAYQDALDSTLYAQLHTPAKKIARHDPGRFAHVHFGYVISTYRRFQRYQGGFADDRFCLLLIRLLIDAYDPDDWPYDVPSIATLVGALDGGHGPIVYPTPVQGPAEHFGEFRAKLEQLLHSGMLTKVQVQTIRNGVGAFDKAYHWPQ